MNTTNMTTNIATMAGILSLVLMASSAQAQQSGNLISTPGAGGGTYQTNADTNTPRSTTSRVPIETSELISQSQQTIDRLTIKNPQMKQYLTNSAGYAVFPTVGEGAAIIGGAYGEGIVFQNGKPVGRTTLTKGTVGAQLGGQAFTEVIFFRSQEDLNEFKQGNFELAAGVNAVAATAGIGAQADFQEGVAVITTSRAGLMAKAAVGGQNFSYEPLAMGGVGSDTQQEIGSGSATNNPINSGEPEL